MSEPRDRAYDASWEREPRLPKGTKTVGNIHAGEWTRRNEIIQQERKKGSEAPKLSESELALPSFAKSSEVIQIVEAMQEERRKGGNIGVMLAGIQKLKDKIAFKPEGKRTQEEKEFMAWFVKTWKEDKARKEGVQKKEKAEPLKAERGTKLLYHQTYEGYLQSIKEKGLIVTQGQRNWPDVNYKGERGEAIYFVQDLDTAMSFAEYDENDPHKFPVVLEIQMPSDSFKEMKSDKNWPGARMWVGGHIKPEWIKRIYHYEYDEKGNIRTVTRQFTEDGDTVKFYLVVNLKPMTGDSSIGAQMIEVPNTPKSYTERAFGTAQANAGENEEERQLTVPHYSNPSGSPGHWTKDAAKGAGMALIDPNGYMLFLRRDGDSDHSGTWALPGGGVERGETPESAAEREAIEEIGYVSTGEYPLSFTTHEPVKFETFVHPVPHQFEPSWLMQHSDYTWRKPDNPPYPLHPGVQNLLYQMRGYTKTHGAIDEDQIAEPSVCDCLDGRAYGL